MMNLLFYVPLYVYEVQEWDRKKQALLSRIKNNTFDYHGIADFQTDRNFQKNKYALDFEGATISSLIGMSSFLSGTPSSVKRLLDPSYSQSIVIWI